MTIAQMVGTSLICIIIVIIALIASCINNYKESEQNYNNTYGKVTYNKKPKSKPKHKFGCTAVHCGSYNTYLHCEDCPSRYENRTNTIEVVEEYVPKYQKHPKSNTLPFNLKKEFNKLQPSEQVIYMWAFEEDLELVKIGITSSHLGIKRIQNVAEKHNTKPIVLAYVKTTKAKAAERLVKKILKERYLTAVSREKIDGHTELAYLPFNLQKELIELLNSLKEDK